VSDIGKLMWIVRIHIKWADSSESGIAWSQTHCYEDDHRGEKQDG